MTPYRWKILVLFGIIALAGWALLPSIRLYSMPAEERYGSDPEVAELRDQSLKLGLDLLGGMHLVLALDRSELTDEQVPDAMDRAMEVLRNRIDQFGVAEPSIQRQGEDRILLQLPGVVDQERVKDLIGATAQLHFQLVMDREESAMILDRVDRALYNAMSGETGAMEEAADTTGLGSNDGMSDSDGTDSGSNAGSAGNDVAGGDGEAGSGDEPLAVPTLAPGETRPLIDKLYDYPTLPRGSAAVQIEDKDRILELVEYAREADLIPPGRDLGVLSKPRDLGGGFVGYEIFVLKRAPEMTGEGIKTASMVIGLDPNRPGQPGVSLSFTPKGTKDFARVTANTVGRQLAIVLDGRVSSAPTINEKIPFGQASINGSFSDTEANDLAIVLRAGALPADLDFLEERTVGPSLGRDSIRTSLFAAMIGAAAVGLFMLIYYRASGVIALIGLTLNITFLMAGLALFRGTLTLPGIAGIVLTIGMAVDANVLVFERIREEIRAGKRPRLAIASGYDSAFSTILDANLTTLISAIVLFWFGTGPIKGFAVTLGIGIIANLYTAVVVTRTLFDTVTSRRSIDELSI